MAMDHVIHTNRDGTTIHNNTIDEKIPNRKLPAIQKRSRTQHA